MSDVQKVDVGIQRSEDGGLVQFGVAFPNGGFFSFAAVRAGDYDEALAADAQTQPNGGQGEQPQPDTPAPTPEAQQPEPTAVPQGEGQ